MAGNVQKLSGYLLKRKIRDFRTLSSMLDGNANQVSIAIKIQKGALVEVFRLSYGAAMECN